MKEDSKIVSRLSKFLTFIIGETNGITLSDTLDLLIRSPEVLADAELHSAFSEFSELLKRFQNNPIDISRLLDHVVGRALRNFFKNFPLTFHEDHIHLTGSLEPEFLFPHIRDLLAGDLDMVYSAKIVEIYGADALPIASPKDINRLIRLKPNEKFDRYLEVLMLPKLILQTREMHRKAAFHMAESQWKKYNVGRIRLKFTLSRSNNLGNEQIPGKKDLTEEDVVLGLYEGFHEFQQKLPGFDFILSPSFRKEANFYDTKNFASKKEHFDYQVEKILELIRNFPFLSNHLLEIDTVGEESELFRKKHFQIMKDGIRRLQYHGLKIRSHHGETWKCLRNGIQSVDNAMNIWHIDTLEHGLSLGVNPNYYLHLLYQRVMEKNRQSKPIVPGTQDYLELEDLDWTDRRIFDYLAQGVKLSATEEKGFIKTKFHTARELEHYQHDVLNRMISKKISVVSLPTSNRRLTNVIPGFQYHPFSWWEKKGVQLKIGTDNYVTLNTDFLQELLILLCSDADNLKIMKLLIVITGEDRRAFISHNLWEMRKTFVGE
jgi:adenosine deaminase